MLCSDEANVVGLFFFFVCFFSLFVFVPPRKQGFLVQAGHHVNTVTKLSSSSELWQGRLTSAVELGQSKSLSAQCGHADCV